MHCQSPLLIPVEYLQEAQVPIPNFYYIPESVIYKYS